MKIRVQNIATGETVEVGDWNLARAVAVRMGCAPCYSEVDKDRRMYGPGDGSSLVFAVDTEGLEETMKRLIGGAP